MYAKIYKTPGAAHARQQFEETRVNFANIVRRGLRAPPLFVALAAAFALAPKAAGAAAAYPANPVRIIVPYAPGGGGDVFARLVAERLTLRMKQSFIVENRAGATGAIGARMVADAAPDGEILLLGQPGEIVINPLISKDLHYKASDLVPVVLVGDAPLILAAPGKAPYSTVKELVDLSKRQAKGLAFASSGTGTPGHLAGATMALQSGGKLTHVPYKGGGTALSDLLGGHVDMFFSGAASVIPLFKSGALKPIAVSSAKRAPSLPNVPTVAEAGYGNFDFTLWGGFFAPKGTPPEIVQTLNREINAILAEPEVKQRLEADCVTVTPNTPEQFAQFVARETEKYQAIIKETDIRFD
jgi:tripartite-type tricarboxylate transporter receptor subunit TctC